MSSQYLSKQDIHSILEKRIKDNNFDSSLKLPHPHELKGNQEAAKLIVKTMNENGKILIVGDYDVDGVVSTAIMMKFFTILGYENATYVIPNRFSDGYGISKSIIEKNPADLIVTVDNGIASFESADFCKEIGTRLIITDHHAIKNTLPSSDVLVNPWQNDCSFPQKEICGASIAWYLCNAIKIEMGLNFSLGDLLEFVSIATIADMMPLTKINRLLVQIGLKKFQNSTSLPSKILKNQLRKTNITSQDIAFNIAPLLNSAGRMSDGNLVVKFLLCDDEREAMKIYSQLETFNQQRKHITQQILQNTQDCLVCENCIIAYGENWHLGVLGIVAANLSQTYCRPAIVMSLKEGILKGSARSYGNINLIESLKPHSEFFIQFGGHAKALGLQMKFENIQGFFKAIQKAKMFECSQKEVSSVLGFLDLAQIDNELLEILAMYEPYGEGNPIPNFICNEQTIAATQTLKSLHQKLEFKTPKRQKAMAFFCQEFYEPNDKINAHFSLQRDGFRGEIMMILKNISRCHS